VVVEDEVVEVVVGVDDDVCVVEVEVEVVVREVLDSDEEVVVVVLEEEEVTEVILEVDEEVEEVEEVVVVLSASCRLSTSLLA